MVDTRDDALKTEGPFELSGSTCRW